MFAAWTGRPTGVGQHPGGVDQARDDSGHVVAVQSTLAARTAAHHISWSVRFWPKTAELKRRSALSNVPAHHLDAGPFQVLAKDGADLHTKNTEGRTPLELARLHGKRMLLVLVLVLVVMLMLLLLLLVLLFCGGDGAGGGTAAAAAGAGTVVVVVVAVAVADAVVVGAKYTHCESVRHRIRSVCVRPVATPSQSFTPSPQTWTMTRHDGRDRLGL